MLLHINTCRHRGKKKKYILYVIQMYVYCNMHMICFRGFHNVSLYLVCNCMEKSKWNVAIFNTDILRQLHLPCYRTDAYRKVRVIRCVVYVLATTQAVGTCSKVSGVLTC